MNRGIGVLGRAKAIGQKGSPYRVPYRRPLRSLLRIILAVLKSVDQNFNVLLKMALGLFEAQRVHEIVGIYKRQQVDPVLNDIGGPVAIGAGTGLFGSVLEDDGKRIGWKGRQGFCFRDSDRDNVGFPCLPIQTLETGRQKREVPCHDGYTDADAHYRFY